MSKTYDNFTTLQGITSSPIDPDIKITEEALDVINQMVVEEEALGIMFTVRGGGCSGYIYDLDFVTKETSVESCLMKLLPVQFLVEGCLVNRHLKLYIPYAAIPIVKGTEIWYDKKLVNGGIKFKNPSASRSCGCGKSFS